MSKEHEMTKLILETIRAKSSKHKNLINENEGDIVPVDASQRSTEEKQFREIVNGAVEFGDFNIDKLGKVVTFDGKFNNGITWNLSTKNGIYFNAPNMELTDEVVDIFKKLSVYYFKWNKEWSENINTEYRDR